MLGACVSAELKENENEDRVKIDRNNNLSICLDNVKRRKSILIFEVGKYFIFNISYDNLRVS